MYKITRTQTALYGHKPPYVTDEGTFRTLNEAMDHIITINDQDTFPHYAEIEEAISAMTMLSKDAPEELRRVYENLIDRLRSFVPEHSSKNEYKLLLRTAGGSLIWEDGDTSFEYGDFRYNIEEEA